MYDYGEACPISRATQVLCERWTLQIVREMFLGASRFSEFQKYLPKISPSLLTSRLKMLVDNGIAIRRRTPEKRGYEYHLTAAGKQLKPVLDAMGTWGMQWVFDSLNDVQMDIATLTRDIAVKVDTDHLPDCDMVFQFTFTEDAEPQKRFVLIRDGKRESCATTSMCIFARRCATCPRSGGARRAFLRRSNPGRSRLRAQQRSHAISRSGFRIARLPAVTRGVGTPDRSTVLCRQT